MKYLKMQECRGARKLTVGEIGQTLTMSKI